MLSEDVVEICMKNFDYVCDRCPLRDVCLVDNDDLPGGTQAEKTATWAQAMNNAAEKV